MHTTCLWNMSNRFHTSDYLHQSLNGQQSAKYNRYPGRFMYFFLITIIMLRSTII